MSQKVLKFKRIYAWAIYKALKSVPPKDYPTTGEIKTTISDILPALKEHVSGFADIMKRAEEVGNQVANKEVSEDESKDKVTAINKEWREYVKAHGDEPVELSLDGDAFKTLREQFDREGWGKTWTANVEEFGELLGAFEEAK